MKRRAAQRSGALTDRPPAQPHTTPQPHASWCPSTGAPKAGAMRRLHKTRCACGRPCFHGKLDIRVRRTSSLHQHSHCLNDSSASVSRTKINKCCSMHTDPRHQSLGDGVSAPGDGGFSASRSRQRSSISSSLCAKQNMFASRSVTPAFRSGRACASPAGPATPSHARASPRSAGNFSALPVVGSTLPPPREERTALNVGPVWLDSAIPHVAWNAARISSARASTKSSPPYLSSRLAVFARVAGVYAACASPV
jgi:hypothetical protein